MKIYVLEEGNEIVASALVIIDRTMFGFSTWEIPGGPLVNDQQSTINNKLLDHIIADAKQDKCFALYFSPILNIETKNKKLKTSKRCIMPEATRFIDLQKSEQEILNQMKQKGRYNIRIAEKHGVIVEESDDIDAFYELIKETTKRDRFKGHSKKHYQKFLTELEGSFLLLASLPQEKKPIAGLLGVIWGETGLYYYGASNASHRAVMAPYALQWQAIRLSKAKGCSSYDLFGIAPPDEYTDARNKSHPSSSRLPIHSEAKVGPACDGIKKNHPWRGVTEFKEKFGGEVAMYPEEKVVVLQPLVHSLLKVKRKLCHRYTKIGWMVGWL